IFHEYAHDVRVIPTDRSPHADPKKYSGMNGDSRGHWEGDTLVVDTMNFSKGRRRMNMHGDFLDENSHIVERFTLIGPDRLRYDLRVDDPTVLAKTWTAPDGHPDLTGIWEMRGTANWNLEGHNGGLGVPPSKSVIVDQPDGKIPYNPASVVKRNAKNPADDPQAKCFLSGVPRINYTPGP